MLDSALVLIWMRNRRAREMLRPSSPSAALVSNEYANNAVISRSNPNPSSAGLTVLSSLVALRTPGMTVTSP